ncbi:MAG TPA: CHASE2 domain-containing protein [Candidatus Angelobacter sp.]
MTSFWHKPDSEGALSFARWLRLNLLLLLATALASVSFPVIGLSRRVGDFYFGIRGSQPASQNVAMVLVDDAALSQYGRWPWPRKTLAQLIRAVHQFKPRAIGIDVLLPEAEDESNDMAFESAIREAGNVVLPAKISDSPGGSEWKDPLPRFAQAAAATGHVQAVLDSDGVCRRIPIMEPSADGPRAAFAVALVTVSRNGNGKLQPEPAAAQRPAIQVLAPTSYLGINYRHQFESNQANPPFVTLSARDLLEGNAGKLLEGKIVLIGFGATELGDRLYTPVSGQTPMPGVEVNANAVDTLLDNKEIKSVGTPAQLLLLLCSSIAALWLVVRWPGSRGLTYLAALMFAEFGAGYFAFSVFHRQFEYGAFLAAGIFAAPLAQLENLFVVDRAISARLRALERLLPHAQAPVAGKIVVPRYGSSASRLHWKLRSLQRLEDELASLYSFDETLLEAMQEALAVYAFDGRLLFHNSSWKTFCERQKLDASCGHREIGQILGLGTELRRLESGALLDKELSLNEALWRVRGIALPWPTAEEPNAVMLLAEDISARRERDQARAEALGFVTHELRTPLIAIQGFAEFLMRYPQQAPGSDAPATIFRESRRLVAMINAYLEVLRMDVGSRPIRLKSVMVRDIVRHVEQILQPLAQAAHIEIDSQISDENQVLNCDESLITGALLNLVSNAVKYSPTGSRVTVRVQNQGKEIEFQVHNPGPAIPPEDLERVFEPYYRVAEQAGAKPGWGLGLAFVKRISEQHGGRVHVSSDPSSGTCFGLVLPVGSNIASEAVV